MSCCVSILGASKIQCFPTKNHHFTANAPIFERKSNFKFKITNCPGHFGSYLFQHFFSPRFLSSIWLWWSQNGPAKDPKKNPRINMWFCQSCSLDTPMKTDMTLENPPFSRGNTSSNGGIFHCDLSFWGRSHLVKIIAIAAATTAIIIIMLLLPPLRLLERTYTFTVHIHKSPWQALPYVYL